MYLQALEINGFKSFAKKTRLVFEPGITAIVGPNGCGKSNVSDAIRWVLGEQRASALRGGAMTDVIFSGTDDFKPLGMAEVSITFADCEKQLGLDFNEVTVTRRVFRTGEGQYFINRNPCRLRDIQRLFMDTGIGTTSYSVMAQGQIDAILSSRPEDRRAIFEEASGITRFRADRREAIRKLDATDQNLARVADVVAELRRQIASLQRQASRARRYKELQAELRKMDLHLCSIRFRTLSERGAALEKAFAGAQEQADALRGGVEDAEKTLAALRAQIDEAEQSISAAVESAAAAHNARAKADESLRAGAERLRENAQWKARDEEEASRTRAVRDDQTRLGEELARRLEGLAAATVKARGELEKARAAFDSLHGDSDEARAALQRLRDESVALERTNARLQNELSEAESADREAILRNERLVADEARLGESERELETRLSGVSAEVANLRSLAESGAEAVHAAEKDLSLARASLSEAQGAHATVRASLAACEARLKVLEEAQKSPDGLPAGAAALLNAKNPLGMAAGTVLGPIADMFSAPKGVRTALQAVLRAWLDAVAVRTGADAATACSLLVAAAKPSP
ncbi:MAG: AAA family ATPase, partial [Kiritimatiellae bacterium]|nr:AAA family ATPase [Kiritimatiellia bacterium]